MSSSFTISQSFLKSMSTESVMLSNHLILYHRLLLLPSIFPRIRVFSSGKLEIAIRDASVGEQVRAENAQAPGTVLERPLGGATLPHSGGSHTPQRSDGGVWCAHSLTHSVNINAVLVCARQGDTAVDTALTNPVIRT